MAEFLQQHAGLHFTLAIVESALFELPTGGYIAQPRVLAKTTNIDRGIVTLDHDGRIAIRPASAAPVPGSIPTRRMTITKERYLENLEREFPGIAQRLNRLVDKLVTYEVRLEFGTDSMILGWHTDDTGSWNLGTISSSGQVFTDHLGLQAHSAGLLDVAKQYLTRLAALVPSATAKKGKTETAWGVAQDGKTISVDALLADEAREDGWIHAIAEFQATVAKHLQGE